MTDSNGKTKIKEMLREKTLAILNEHFTKVEELVNTAVEVPLPSSIEENESIENIAKTLAGAVLFEVLWSFKPPRERKDLCDFAASKIMRNF